MTFTLFHMGCRRGKRSKIHLLLFENGALSCELSSICLIISSYLGKSILFSIILLLSDSPNRPDPAPERPHPQVRRQAHRTSLQEEDWDDLGDLSIYQDDQDGDDQ